MAGTGHAGSAAALTHPRQPPVPESWPKAGSPCRVTDDQAEVRYPERQSASSRALFVIFLALGLGYELLYLRRLPKADHIPGKTPLTVRQIAVLVTVLLGGIVLIAGTIICLFSLYVMASLSY